MSEEKQPIAISTKLLLMRLEFSILTSNTTVAECPDQIRYEG